MAGDVDHFADEVQAGLVASFQCFRGKLARIDPAQRDFGFFIADCTARPDAPVVQALRDFSQPGSAEPFHWLVLVVNFHPALGEALRQEFAEQVGEQFFGSLGGLEDFPRVPVRQQIDRQILSLPPVRGNLQDGGSGQAAMGDEQVFAEARAVATDHRIDREAGKVGELLQVVRREREPDERRAQLGDLEPELLRDAITERAGADLRNRQAAAGDDQRLAIEVATIGLDLKSPGLFNRADFRRHAPLHPCGVALGLEQVYDLLRGAVAEQLAEFFLMPGDAMLFHQADEIARRVTRQRRAAEIRIGGKEILRPRAAVGEIAATAAGNADLLSQLLGMIDQQHAAPAFSCLDCAHDAGGAGADDDDVGAHGAGLPFT